MLIDLGEGLPSPSPFHYWVIWRTIEGKNASARVDSGRELHFLIRGLLGPRHVNAHSITIDVVPGPIPGKKEPPMIDGRSYPARLYLDSDSDLDASHFSLYAKSMAAARDHIELLISRTMIIRHTVTVELLPDPDDGIRRPTIAVRCYT